MHDPAEIRWLRWLLTGILFFLAVIAVELSVLIGPLQPRAAAQVPDGGLQRKQLLEAQTQTNATLKAILEHLRTQVIKVKVEGTDKDTKSRPRPEPRPADAPPPLPPGR